MLMPNQRSFRDSCPWFNINLTELKIRYTTQMNINCTCIDYTLLILNEVIWKLIEKLKDMIKVHINTLTLDIFFSSSWVMRDLDWFLYI